MLLAVTSVLLLGTARGAVVPLDQDFRISSMGPDGSPNYDAFNPSIAYNPTANEYLVVWSGDDNTGSLADEEAEIYAQRVSASGALLGGRIRVSDMGPDGNTIYAANSPSVAYNPAYDQYLVVWSGDDTAGTLVNDENEIFGQLLGATGEPVGANDFRISEMGPDGDTAYDAFQPTVAHNSVNNLWLVSWRSDDNTGALVNEEFEVYGQVLTAVGGEGFPFANDFRISDMGPDGDPDSDAYTPSIAYSSVDNQFLVTWEGQDNTAPLVKGESEIFGQRLNSLGVEGGANDFRISDSGPDGSTLYGAYDPAVAYSSTDNRFLVTWSAEDDTAPLVNDEYEVFGQFVDRTGVEVGANDFRISDMGPNGATEYTVFSSSVAHNASENQYLVVWWGDDNTGPLVDNEYEVFGQLLDGAGAQVGDNDFRVSDMGPDGSSAYGASEPAVAYSTTGKQYLAVWSGDDNTAPLVDQENEIFGQRVGELPVTPPPPPPPPPTPPATDRTAPVVSAFAVSPKRVRRGRLASFRFRLSERAAARILLERTLPGRRVGRRCARPTARLRRNRRCTRIVRAGTLIFSNRPAGANRIAFRGRIGRRKLAIGTFRATITATDAAGNRARARRANFRIVRP